MYQAVCFIEQLQSRRPATTINSVSNPQDFQPLPLADASSSGHDASYLAGSATEFEPVLNVPAFSVFLGIAIVFSLFQWRVSQIGDAADERNKALTKLRQLKSAELSNEASEEEVTEALNRYEEAYWRVENLRNVLPGVRLVPPPSESLNRRLMEENVVAAQQFLDIQPEAKDAAKSSGKLSPGAVTVLILLALSQLALLGLFLGGLDPILFGTPLFDGPILDNVI